MAPMRATSLLLLPSASEDATSRHRGSRCLERKYKLTSICEADSVTPGFPQLRRFGTSLFRTLRSNDLLLFALLFPISVRALPEILAGRWPLGTDTVWIYAPFLKSVNTQGLEKSLEDVFSLHGAPLFLVLLGSVEALVGADPFLLIKAAAPLLHGFLVFSMFYFAKRGLDWDRRRCFLVVVLATLYFVPLRFSWDMYKNGFGLALLIMAFTHLKSSPTWRDRGAFVAFAAMSILSSELTTLLIGAVAGVLFLFDRFRRDRWSVEIAVTSIVALFAAFVYAGVLFPVAPPATPLAALPRGSMFPYDYVGATDGMYSYASLADVYAGVLVLSTIVLAPLVPFAWLGLHNERRLWAWSGILEVFAFSILVMPYAAIPVWHRWLFMLVFPLIFFNVQGLARYRRRIALLFVAGIIVLAASFLALPPGSPLPYFANPETLPYVPSSMMQNTVPLQNCQEIVDAVRWLNGMPFNQSVLLAPISFFGWAELYSTIPRIYGFVSPRQVDGGNFSGYQHVLLLYWAPQQGWYDPQLMPSGMAAIHVSGQIAIYQRPAGA